MSALIVGIVTALVSARLARASERAKWERERKDADERHREEREEKNTRRRNELARERAVAHAQQPLEAAALTLSSAIAYFVVGRPNERRDRVFIAPGDRLYVGRDPSLSALVLATPVASKRHFILEATERSVFVIDLGSTSGTFVNGNKVNERLELVENDSINVSDDSTVLVYHRLA
jgi:FHA domain